MGLGSILLTPLKQIPHPQGDIFHAMKKDDPGYVHFGEAYFSTIHTGQIKAWKKHKMMTLNLVVPVGEVGFVIFDETSKKFMTVTLSPKHYQRLTVPAGLWTGFKGLSNGLNLILNVADIVHDPEECERKEIEEISYDWKSLISI